MQKRASLRTALIFLLFAFIVVFAAASFIGSMDRLDRITANAVNSEIISISGVNAIMVPGSSQPLPNIEEGTVEVWTKPPIEVFGQFDDARKYIVFYSAENKPGLRVVYNLQDNVFEAGMPILRSSEVDIFDDGYHQVVYTFKKGVGQSLFIDGQKVAESEFIEATATRITGFIIGTGMTPDDLDEVDIKGVEVAAYDRYVTAEELDLLK